MTRYAQSNVKRLVERFCAFVLLVIASPIMAICSLVVRLGSGTPVFYGDRRIGRGGHPFTLWKFRTMRLESGARITAANDPRITPTGSLLRRFKLDELPQLWNVLRGEMNLIGPRPETPEFVDVNAPEWVEVLSVPPGIAGAASIVFFNETERLAAAADPLSLYRSTILPEKLAIERTYLRSCTPLLDFGLLVRTVCRIFQTTRSRTT